MNIEQLRQRIADQIKEVSGVRLKKLNAVDGLAYAARYMDMPEEAPLEQAADAYAFLLSKCIVDEQGNKTLDSDEGRALLLQLTARELSELGEAAIEWCLGSAKKN